MQITAIDAAVAGASPWWALYTRHQHEKTVAGLLQAKGFDVFLPLYESMRRWKDRRKMIALPLFPGYVFVRGGLERRLQIVTTPGIHMILCRGERVATIPDEEIQAVHRAVAGKLIIEPHPYLQCGERVRVKRGALEGVEGILVRRKNGTRLVLSVDMLAQSACVEIDAADVEAVALKSAATAARVNEPENMPESPTRVAPAASRWHVPVSPAGSMAHAG